MALAVALAVASTLMSAKASMDASKAAMREAAIRQKQFDRQMKEGQLSALIAHNNRVAQQQSFIATNESIVGTTGRDYDRSYRAIKERADRELAIESDRAYVQHLAEQANISLAAKLSMEKGKNIAQAYKYQAISTIISGGMRTQKLIGSTPDGSKSWDYM